MSTRPQRPARLAAGSRILLVSAALLAGCGGTKTDPGTTTGPVVGVSASPQPPPPPPTTPPPPPPEPMQPPPT